LLPVMQFILLAKMAIDIALTEGSVKTTQNVEDSRRGGENGGDKSEGGAGVLVAKAGRPVKRHQKHYVGSSEVHVWPGM